MIPGVDDVYAAYAFLAARYGYRRALHHDGVTKALALARELAGVQDDEPAALFFGLTRFAKSLGEAPAALPALLAANHAATLGFRRRPSLAELRELFVPIASGTMGYEQARTWFAEHLAR